MSELKPKLSLYGLTMIAIGACIGSGIFLTPNVVTQQIPHTYMILGVWLIGGIIAIFGALTFAELGSRFPESGGVYVYLKEAFGPLVGFLYGWVILLIINTGALAALSVGLVSFLGLFMDFDEYYNSYIACGIIIFLTIINIYGVKISEFLTNVFTGAKLLAIFIIVIIAFFVAPDISTQTIINEQINIIPDNLFNAFFLSLVAVFWSFGGWHHTTYLSAEAINAKRNIPLSMVLGTGIVTLTYLAVNYAYMQALPLSEISASNRVAGDAMESLIPGGGKFVGILVIISITGTIAIYTMSAPRIYFAMAKDKVFFSQLSKIHAKYKTPVNAMFLQAIWAVILVLTWKHFVKLITFVTFMDIIFMTAAATTIFIFRRKININTATVKTPGFPIIPSIFIIVTSIFIVNTAMSLQQESAVGLIILLIGIPVYYAFKRNNTNKLKEPTIKE